MFGIDLCALNEASANARRALATMGVRLYELRRPILVAELRKGEVYVIACHHGDVGRAWTEMQMRAARRRRRARGV